MMKVFLFAMVFFVGVGSVSAAAAVTPKPKKVRASLPGLLVEVEKKYSEVGTLEAQFSQVNDLALLKKKQESTGKIYFKKPGKLRWDTLKPDKSNLVSDGKVYWYYTPPFEEGERGQVIEKKSAEVQSKLAQLLLTGAFKEAVASKSMTITALAANRFSLKPKADSAGTVEKAEITIDLTDKLITEVFLSHANGNTSRIQLSEIKLGKKLDNSFFQFKAPPNTDIVRDANE